MSACVCVSLSGAPLSPGRCVVLLVYVSATVDGCLWARSILFFSICLILTESFHMRLSSLFSSLWSQ